MKVFRNFDEASGIRNPIVTTGSFDGVHIGHKTIINRLRMLAEKYDGESVLITFHPHPRKVLYPDTSGKDLKLISSQEEKLFLLEKAGVDNLLVIEFTREFSKISSEEFVRDLLIGKLGARVVVVGFNHHFGFNKEGDYKQLWNMREKYDFDAEEIPEQEVQHESVSSTRIRKAITEGYIQRANAYLDHYYIVMGIPVHAGPFETGDLYPFYRMTISDESKLLPSDGIYAVSAMTGNSNLKAMVVISSVNSGNQELYFHIPDPENDIAGLVTTLSFQKKLKGPVNLKDRSASAPKLRDSLEEISELIY
jgi:riboflavin kinase / FMN adenylyltransferase